MICFHQARSFLDHATIANHNVIPIIRVLKKTLDSGESPLLISLLITNVDDIDCSFFPMYAEGHIAGAVHLEVAEGGKSLESLLITVLIIAFCRQYYCLTWIFRARCLDIQTRL